MNGYYILAVLVFFALLLAFAWQREIDRHDAQRDVSRRAVRRILEATWPKLTS